jgi:hypothetical protein
MQLLDPKFYTKDAHTLAPASRAATGDNNGSAVDTLGFSGGWAKVKFHAGALDNAVTLTGVVQESDTSGGTYTDISNSGFTINTTNDDNTVVAAALVRLQSRKQFLRVKTTHAASANACIYGVSIGLIRPDSQRDVTFETYRAEAV